MIDDSMINCAVCSKAETISGFVFLGAVCRGPARRGMNRPK